MARARRMADALAEAGIGGAYEGAMKYVTSERLISRTHFARFLVASGVVSQVWFTVDRMLLVTLIGLAGLEVDGKIKIVGTMYDVASGVVTLV
jgi:hypothetical protein